MRRHPDLTLRSPQPTTIGRASCFNKPVVDAFFVNLSKLISKYSFAAADIYNVDESGLPTVRNPPKIIAQKGAKAVGAISSAERGTTVTVICTVNAFGNSVPPMLIFPRVRFQEHMVIGAPPATIGVANPSGWSNSEMFEIYMDHFIKHSRPTKDKPILLLLDNHESHLSVEVINKAKENGIVKFTFPPHTTHKLQPLDRVVFGPLKKFYYQQCQLWMNNNPGKPITIYNVASVLGKAYPQAFTPVNVQSGFRSSGIYPLNPNVFTEADFLPSAPSDRPLLGNTSSDFPPTPGSSGNQQAGSSTLNDTPTPNSVLHQEPTPGPRTVTPNSDVVSSRYISPVEIRPLPRVQLVPGKRRGRKLGKSRVLTDTPEKCEIEEAARARAKRRSTQPLQKEKGSVKKKLFKKHTTHHKDHPD